MSARVLPDGFGGWLAVTTVQAGGGIYAQRLVMRNHYDMDRAKELALRMLIPHRERVAGAAA